jgi:hypothetical protein
MLACGLGAEEMEAPGLARWRVSPATEGEGNRGGARGSQWRGREQRWGGWRGGHGRDEVVVHGLIGEGAPGRKRGRGRCAISPGTRGGGRRGRRDADGVVVDIYTRAAGGGEEHPIVDLHHLEKIRSTRLKKTTMRIG